jgi:hypothetical protein
MAVSLPSLDAETFAAFEAYVDRIASFILAREDTHRLRRTSRSEAPSNAGLYALYDSTGLI